jgi:hypothetical protein
MKYTSFLISSALTLLSLQNLYCLNIRSNNGISKNINNKYLEEVPLKVLDPTTVKSPGQFDNVAPSASKIITPEYAGIN